MRMFPLALAAGLVCLLAGNGGAVAACKAGADSLFEDQFSTLDDPWGQFENYDVEDGQLVIKPPAGFNTSTINNSSLYDDVDVCVDVTAQAPAQQGDCGSIIFWAVDYDNYYAFQVSTDGQASFWRRQRGRWLNQVSWQNAQGIEKGATVINELRVITKGKTAKLFINGTLFKDVKGQPPKDGALIGLLACSPNNASAHMAFDNLVVNPPGIEPEPASAQTDEQSSGGDKSGGGGAGSGSEPTEKSDADKPDGAAPSDAAPGGGESGPSIGAPKN
jgi:hypothetical protein